MQITKRRTGDTTEVVIEGRLDAYWADHLKNELQSEIREGSHHLSLDLSKVDYISSAGIRVLLTSYQQLTQIHGSLSLSSVSAQAKSILEMAGLAEILLRQTAPAAPAVVAQTQKLDSVRATYEMYSVHPGGTLNCKIMGDPAVLENRSTTVQPEKIRVMKNSFAFGLGAFGDSWEDSKFRCGEFLAVSGAAAYLPTDGTGSVDYLVASGTYYPELMVVYGALCTGEFPRLIRFESKKEFGSVSLAEIVETAVEGCGTTRLGIVLIGESAGLVGASLLRSPVGSEVQGGIFEYPETVNWLSFTAERAYSRSLALVVGMTDDAKSSIPLLRAFDANSKLSGHFHAAAFPYRPIKKGELDVNSTVSTLFEAGTIEGVLHLLRDDRTIGGAGESEFIRGACWAGPVTEVTK